jgi:hypothetical protein
MRRPDEGNPRAGYVGIHAMIPDTRVRQPRDGQMKCGNQSADISMINRRHKLPARRVTRPVSVSFELQHNIAENPRERGRCAT